MDTCAQVQIIQQKYQKLLWGRGSQSPITFSLPSTHKTSPKGDPH